jgi:hypothetical protein
MFPVLLLLAGCAAEPGAGPTPIASSSTPEPSSSTAPSSEQPPVPEEPAAPSETETETETEAAEFTTPQLVDLCTGKIRELAPDATYATDRATTEWLAPVSLWFVVVPKEIDSQQSAGICGIGGDSASPVFEMHGETLVHGVEEARADLLAAHEHSG